MPKELRFDDKVVIVTGAGNGLGRSHALMFAARGAKVVVNDLGGGAHGEGKSSAAADEVVALIKEAGGEAVANYDSVEDGAKIVQTAMDHFGRIDVVVNNAGILRDTSFAKLSEEDWDLIYRVHVLGSFRVTHAAWPHMREQQYGRVIMTASAAGIYGNFGQTNYAMAKLGLVGFANTLALEGRKRNIFTNVIAPIAGSRLTETVLPGDLIAALKPEFVSPLVLWLANEKCKENGGLFEVGGGYFGKLRWERTKGHTVRLGREVTPELVQANWDKITDFSESEHPENINASMGPILANIQAGPSKGGNEFIDVDLALGFELPPQTSSYDERDLALYALGVGAAEDPHDDKDLQLVYEMHGKGFKALPTYGVIPALNTMMNMAKQGIKAPGMNYGLDRVLHGEQYTEIAYPLPKSAELEHRFRIKDIWDKGKGAVVVSECKSFDEDGNLLMRNEISTFVRGAGGWGGERGPSSKINLPPEREPDAVAEQQIHENQALLYRLSGDWNPLHADPRFAKAFGFEKPILHGLCTFGYAGRHVINAFCDGDPRYFKSIKTRFADSVFPGETLVTEMWKESDTRIIFQCKVKERDSLVISNAAIELYSEIPQRPEKKAPAPAAEAAPTASAEPTVADVFAAMSTYVSQHPELVDKVGHVYKFAVTDPDSEWTLDLKNAPGSLEEGETQDPECVFALSADNFMAMVNGEADPQKLFFSGGLKITGNVMASQKLDFLTKLDPAEIKAAASARAGGGGGAATSAPAKPTSREIFTAIGAYVDQHPELAEQVGVVYLFKVGDSDYTVDLKNAPGSVSEGDDGAAECTLALSEADFMAMTAGEADPQKMFFEGRLKVSGNVMASQKLTFLQEIDPKEVEKALKASQAGGGGPKKAKKKKDKVVHGPAVFDKLAAHIAANPGLVGDVGAVIVFHTTGPEGTWTVDLKSGAGSVAEGAVDGAGCVITLSDANLGAVVAGDTSLKALFQRAEAEIGGEDGFAVAHRLNFLSELS